MYTEEGIVKKLHRGNMAITSQSGGVCELPNPNGKFTIGDVVMLGIDPATNKVVQVWKEFKESSDPVPDWVDSIDSDEVIVTNE